MNDFKRVGYDHGHEKAVHTTVIVKESEKGRDNMSEEQVPVQPTDTPEAPVEAPVNDFLVDIPDIPMPDEQSQVSEVVEDECKGAFKLAFIGSGQGGSRIAEAFWKLGYRRVCCVNTTGQDLVGINIPESNKLIMDIGSGGAGKDPAKGEQAAKTHYEDVYDLMRRSFGKEIDRIIVCIGAGGGTGSGSAETLISIAHDMAQSLKVEDATGIPRVGAIVALPKVAEGAKVNANAYGLLQSLFAMVGTGKGKIDGRSLTPLIVVDNDRIDKIYPNLPVTKFWDVANRSISSLLHLFNSIAIQDSDFTTFDRADLTDVLDSGMVSFGACPIRKWDTSTDISFAIRDNLKNNVLVGGFDIAQARTAACIFIGHSDVLSSIPQGHLEHGFEMLCRIMRQGGAVHRGIYKGSKPGLVVYSILGELSPPKDRMDEIARVGRTKPKGG